MIAGTGTSADGVDAQTPTAVGIGASKGIAIDSTNNIYYTDTTYFRVRGICYAVSGSTSGWCAGKTAGNMYRIAGTGVTGDTADNVAASSSAIGPGYGLALDSFGNQYFSDFTYKRVRIQCVDVTSNSFCTGRTIGNTYRMAGTGAAADGVHNSQADITSPGNNQQISVDSKGNVFIADATYFKIRAVCNMPGLGGYCDQLTQGFMYTVVGVGTPTVGFSAVPAYQTPIGTPQGVAIDASGNMYITDSTNFRVRVVCANTTVGACIGKAVGKSYFIAGTGTSGDAVDAVTPTNNTIVAVFGVAVDSAYNVYLADNTYKRIRVICYAAALGGTCNARTTQLMYRLAGTGVAADGAKNSVASSTGIGSPTGIAVDDLFNVYIADPTYFRARAICYTTTGGYCNAKTAGNMYQVAGTGVTGDGATASVASTTTVGALGGIAVDSYRNIWLADPTYFRVRAICNNNSGGYCSGKTAGNIYRVAGTGVTGDGVTAGTAASTATGAVNGIAVDTYGNVFFADTTNKRIRVVCNTLTGGYCAGQVVDTSYRLSGNNGAGDAVSNIDGSTSALDMSANAILAIHPTNNDVLFSGATAIRYIRGWP